MSPGPDRELMTAPTQEDVITAYTVYTITVISTVKLREENEAV